MFTAIIPTMWKSPRITQLIADLCNCDEVGEVLIIDNDPTNEQPFTNHSKIAIHLMIENTFVNPAWNYGVERAKYDNIAIINDDVNFDADVFKIYDCSLQQIGIIGMASENYSLKKTHNIHLKLMKSRPYGWGCFMMLHKSKYVPIPDDLLIANGDDWLAKHATPFVLHGLAIQSEISTTSRIDEFGMQQLKDNETYMTKYGT